MNMMKRLKKSNTKHVPHSYLIKKFTYDKDTGEFRRLSKRGFCYKTGYTDKDGYLAINILGRRYGQHRLAWFYVTGEEPNGVIDHIDGNRSNNSFKNLRVVSCSTNQENQRRARPNSRTGLLGVCVHHSKYRAKITVKGKEIVLGRFSSPEDAHLCYLKAKQRLHKGCTIGMCNHTLPLVENDKPTHNSDFSQGASS